jgi:hypothetical protein
MDERDDYAEPGQRPGMLHFWKLFFMALVVALLVGWLVWVIFLTAPIKENR